MNEKEYDAFTVPHELGYCLEVSKAVLGVSPWVSP